MNKNILILPDKSQTMLLGETFSKVCMMGCIIYLNGYIGTGKTVFCKGFLRGLGYKSYVKSPTYTIIESYFLFNTYIHHCDCYRLNSETELIEIGIQDYFDGKSIFLIEWPIQKSNILPPPDIIITMNYDDLYETYRRVVINTISGVGQDIMNAFVHLKKIKYEIKI